LHRVEALPPPRDITRDIRLFPPAQPPWTAQEQTAQAQETKHSIFGKAPSVAACTGIEALKHPRDKTHDIQNKPQLLLVFTGIKAQIPPRDKQPYIQQSPAQQGYARE
jgi:hypothetical protein